MWCLRCIFFIVSFFLHGSIVLMVFSGGSFVWFFFSFCRFLVTFAPPFFVVFVFHLGGFSMGLLGVVLFVAKHTALFQF